MQKPFNALALWLLVMILLITGSFGILLPAVFNMDSDLMFIALPTAILVVVGAAWWVATRLARAVMRLCQAIDERTGS